MDLIQKITSWARVLLRSWKLLVPTICFRKLFPILKKKQRYSEIREVLDLFRTGVSTMHWCTVSVPGRAEIDHSHPLAIIGWFVRMHTHSVAWCSGFPMIGSAQSFCSNIVSDSQTYSSEGAVRKGSLVLVYLLRQASPFEFTVECTLGILRVKHPQSRSKQQFQICHPTL